jgi:hypothetical protein
MPQASHPDPGPNGEEPDSSSLPPAADEDGPEDDGEGSFAQGLHVCLPAEQVTLAGFAQNGEAGAFVRFTGFSPAIGALIIVSMDRCVSSNWTDGTIDLFRRARPRHSRAPTATRGVPGRRSA